MSQSGGQSPVGTFGRASLSNTPRTESFATLEGPTSPSPASRAARRPPRSTFSITPAETPTHAIEADAPESSLRSPSPLDPRQHWRGGKISDDSLPALNQYPQDGTDDDRHGYNDHPGPSTIERNDGSSSEVPQQNIPTAYGLGERGGLNLLDNNGDIADDITQARKRFSAERSRLLEEDRAERSSRARVDTHAEPTRSSRSSILLSSHIATARQLSSLASSETTSVPSTSQRRPRSGSSARRRSQRDERTKSLPNPQSRPRLPSPSASSSSRRRKRQSLTFLMDHSAQENANDGDDESDTRRARRREAGRARAHSAPEESNDPAQFTSIPMTRFSGSGIQSSRSRSQATGSLVIDEEQTAAYQRRLSDAHLAAAHALSPRFPPSTGTSAFIDSASERKRLKRPSTGAGDNSVGSPIPSWQRVATFLHRSSLPLRIVVPVVITLFLDFNSIFVLANLALHSPDQPTARQNPAWWIAFAIYLFCSLLSLCILAAKLVRAYTLYASPEGPLAIRTYLSDLGRMIQMLRSQLMYNVVVSVDRGASLKSQILETAWRISESWPFALLSLPRLVITVVVTVLFHPAVTQTGFTGSPNLDPFFFVPPTGRLSEYGFGVILASCAWYGLGGLIVTASFACIRILGRQEEIVASETAEDWPTMTPPVPHWHSSTTLHGRLNAPVIPRLQWQRQTEDRLRAALLRHSRSNASGFEMVVHRSYAKMPISAPRARASSTGQSARSSLLASLCSPKGENTAGVASQPSLSPAPETPKDVNFSRTPTGRPHSAYSGTGIVAIPFPSDTYDPQQPAGAGNVGQAIGPADNSLERMRDQRVVHTPSPDLVPTSEPLVDLEAGGRGTLPASVSSDHNGSSADMYVQDNHAANLGRNLWPGWLRTRSGSASRQYGSTKGSSTTEQALKRRSGQADLSSRASSELSKSHGSQGYDDEIPPTPVATTTGLQVPVATDPSPSPRRLTPSPLAASRESSTTPPPGKDAIQRRDMSPTPASEYSSDDSEERRLYSTFPEQSRLQPPGLIFLQLQQQREEALERQRQLLLQQQQDARQSEKSDKFEGVSEDTSTSESELADTSAREHDSFPEAIGSQQYGVSPSAGGLMAIMEEGSMHGGSSSRGHDTPARSASAGSTAAGGIDLRSMSMTPAISQHSLAQASDEGEDEVEVRVDLRNRRQPRSEGSRG